MNETIAYIIGGAATITAIVWFASWKKKNEPML